MTSHVITVSIGGGHELERAGLAALAACLPGLRVVLLEKQPQPQVLIWLVGNDPMEIIREDSGTSLLLITEHADFEPFPESVLGLFSRDESPAALGIAIRQVARGEQYLSPSLAGEILQKHQAESESTVSESEISQIDTLTEREREILALLAQGLSNKMIASRLYLSVRTVEGHLATIYLRLGVHSRTEAMLRAVQIR